MTDENGIKDDYLKEEIMRRFGMRDKMADCVILVASGMEPIDAVAEAYEFKDKTNHYKQLKDLLRNEKFDKALKYLGYNLRDRLDKHAFGVVRELEKIAFGPNTSIPNKLAALKELAKYNPILQELSKHEDDSDQLEKDELELAEFFGGEDA